jgi:hypothetical protein
MKVGFDFDDTLTTEKGMRVARFRNNPNNELYIVSARHEVGNDMLAKAKELGINPSHVFATGSNKAKVEKVISLGLNMFYDNNKDVIEALNGTGIKAFQI